MTIRELPPSEWGRLGELFWDWMWEFPEAHFDDSSPATAQEFLVSLEDRAERHERLYLMETDKPVGVIGYAPMDTRTGMLRGVCFTKSVHGSGLPQEAMREVLARLAWDGVEKVSANYHASNTHVRRYLSGLGFEDEGLLKRQVMRHGKASDLILVATHLR